MSCHSFEMARDLGEAADRIFNDPRFGGVFHCRHVGIGLPGCTTCDATITAAEKAKLRLLRSTVLALRDVPHAVYRTGGGT